MALVYLVSGLSVVVGCLGIWAWMRMAKDDVKVPHHKVEITLERDIMKTLTELAEQKKMNLDELIEHQLADLARKSEKAAK